MKATNFNGNLSPIIYNNEDQIVIIVPVSQATASENINCDVQLTGGTGRPTFNPRNPDTCRKIVLNNLPEITDSKTAEFTDEPVLGRSFPVKTYRSSGNRSINMKVNFFSLERKDIKENFYNLRALQSAVYPEDSDERSPYLPPPICRIKCGQLFTSENGGFICVVLRSASVTYQTNVAWDEYTMLPLKFSVDLQFEVVFSNQSLPGQNKIFNDFSFR